MTNLWKHFMMSKSCKLKTEVSGDGVHTLSFCPSKVILIKLTGGKFDNLSSINLYNASPFMSSKRFL